ncbi:MAG TPA: ABC transporter substrate-binding protein [Solirubrobacterales bacterium]|nr:ABC transporter substrate-binding protein [Solirubrobacterales bacterium]
MAVLLLIGVGGCGGGGSETTTAGETTKTSETTKASSPKVRVLEVTIDGRFGPQTAGIVMAKELGYFEEAGLEVILYNPSNPSRPVRYVNERVVDLSITHEPEVVLAREKGVPILAIRSMIARPTAAMIWPKKSGIRSIADLRGKTIAIPGVLFQKLFLQSILARAGLTLADVKLKVVGYGLVHALVSGKADAIFGGSWNIEGVELEKQGVQPIVKRVQSFGMPSYDELVMIARRDRLARDPQEVRNFMSAVSRGTAAALAHPKAAAKAIAEIAKELEGETKSVHVVEAEMRRTLPLLSRGGRMSAVEAKRLVSWMHGEGLLQRPLPPSAFMTNDYLSKP